MQGKILGIPLVLLFLVLLILTPLLVVDWKLTRQMENVQSACSQKNVSTLVTPTPTVAPTVSVTPSVTPFEKYRGASRSGEVK